MANKNTTQISFGGGLCTWLTVAFVVLKLLGKIAWSWWWVFSPLWIPPAIIVAVLLGIGVILGPWFLVARALERK
jgi:hypothetical protein